MLHKGKTAVGGTSSVSMIHRLVSCGCCFVRFMFSHFFSFSLSLAMPIINVPSQQTNGAAAVKKQCTLRLAWGNHHEPETVACYQFPLSGGSLSSELGKKACTLYMGDTKGTMPICTQTGATNCNSISIVQSDNRKEAKKALTARGSTMVCSYSKQTL